MWLPTLCFHLKMLSQAKFRTILKAKRTRALLIETQPQIPKSIRIVRKKKTELRKAQFIGHYY